jgi:hypothetical protein
MEEDLMEEGPYFNDSQRAIIAARIANRPGAAHKNHPQRASIEAPISQSEAARRLKVGRSSVQRAASLVKNAAPELVAAVEAGLIAVSTASRLLALPKIEQIKIATADNPGHAARQAAGQLGMKSRSDIDLTRLSDRLTSTFEKTPTGEMQELVRLFCDQRAISYKECEKLAELARACVPRIADLASRLDEPNLCGYQYCGKAYNQRRSRRVPDAKYCSRSCAQRAGEPSAWKRP